jgi:hypothetical protein
MGLNAGSNHAGVRVLDRANRADEVAPCAREPQVQAEELERHAGSGTPDEPLVTAMRSLVSSVDDNESMRESLPDLLRQFGFATQAFSSAEAFLAWSSSARRAA